MLAPEEPETVMGGLADFIGGRGTRSGTGACGGYRILLA
jgi:hypothetical protein